jgi:hypothetical protein
MGQLRQRHVLQCAEFRQQVVELVDKADQAPPRRRARPVRGGAHLPPGDRDRARIRRVQQPRDMQKRRLPRARRRHEAHDLARHDLGEAPRSTGTALGLPAL